MAVPGTAHRSGKDGDPAIAFLGIEVGDGRPVMDLASLVGGAGEVEDPFGEGGLAGIDVGEDAQIANGGQRTGEMTVQVGTHGPWPFGVIRNGAARSPDELACSQATQKPLMRRTAPEVGRPGGSTPFDQGSVVRHGHPVPAAQPEPGAQRHQDHLVP